MKKMGRKYALYLYGRSMRLAEKASAAETHGRDATVLMSLSNAAMNKSKRIFANLPRAKRKSA